MLLKKNGTAFATLKSLYYIPEKKEIITLEVQESKWSNVCKN